MKFYVTDDEDGRAQLEQYTRGLDCEYTVTPLADNDWAYSWQKYYKPLDRGGASMWSPSGSGRSPFPRGRVPSI